MSLVVENTNKPENNTSTPGVAYLFSNGTLGATPTTSSNNSVLLATYFNSQPAQTNAVNIENANVYMTNTWTITLDSAANYWNTFIGGQFVTPTLLETFAIINSSTSSIVISGSSSVTLANESMVTVMPNGGVWSISILFQSITQTNGGPATSGVAKAILIEVF